MKKMVDGVACDTEHSACVFDNGLFSLYHLDGDQYFQVTSHSTPRILMKTKKQAEELAIGAGGELKPTN